MEEREACRLVTALPKSNITIRSNIKLIEHIAQYFMEHQVPCDAIDSAVQYSTVQYSTVQNSSIQVCTENCFVKHHDIVRPMLFNVHFDNLVSLSKSTFCSHGDLLSCPIMVFMKRRGASLVTFVEYDKQ